MQSKEHKASVSNSNSPERANLSWGYWPVAVAPLTIRGQRLWPEVLRGWPGKLRVAVARAQPVDNELVSPWAQAVRQCGLVAALAIAPAQCTATWLANLPEQVPLLLVLCGDQQSDAKAWQNAIALLALLRQPLLRWTTLRAPLCWLPTDLIGPSRGDVGLAELSNSAPTGLCLQCAEVGKCAARSEDLPGVRPLPAAITNQFDLVLDGPGAQIGWLREGLQAQPLAQTEARLKALTLVPGQVGADQVALAVERQQLYRDVSHSARLEDFASELVPLQVDALRLPPLGQESTAEPNAALPVWRVCSLSPFANEEEGLLQLLAGLRGTVVDVGAGPVRYVEALTRAIAEGQLCYVAVEPDQAHLQRSSSALSAGLFVRGVGEQLPLADASADAVLMLRSWNHLQDPALAVAEAERVLRPGGKLVVVDNVMFGLVRDAEQLARAHAIPLQSTPFEHYRNHDALEAWALVAGRIGSALRLEAVHPVQAGTSNQWLLVAVKALAEPH